MDDSKYANFSPVFDCFRSFWKFVQKRKNVTLEIILFQIKFFWKEKKIFLKFSDANADCKKVDCKNMDCKNMDCKKKKIITLKIFSLCPQSWIIYKPILRCKNFFYSRNKFTLKTFFAKFRGPSFLPLPSPWPRPPAIRGFALKMKKNA